MKVLANEQQRSGYDTSVISGKQAAKSGDRRAPHDMTADRARRQGPRRQGPRRQGHCRRCWITSPEHGSSISAQPLLALFHAPESGPALRYREYRGDRGCMVRSNMLHGPEQYLEWYSPPDLTHRRPRKPALDRGNGRPAARMRRAPFAGERQQPGDAPAAPGHPAPASSRPAGTGTTAQTPGRCCPGRNTAMAASAHIHAR